MHLIFAERAVNSFERKCHLKSTYQGPRSKFSSGGAKEECVKENFFVGPVACLWISIQFL